MLGKLQQLALEIGADDFNEDDEEEGGGHGNTRIPFGLCQREGIAIQPGWTPSDAWAALEGKGYSASGVYRDMSELSKLERERNVKREGGTRGSFINRVVTEEVRNALKTKPNEAIFFSNCSKTDNNGKPVKYSPDVAKEYAEGNKGVTMEMLLEGVDIPEWDFNASNSVSRWEGASRAYAEQASGDVRVIARMPLREGNIFEAVEFPTLKKNKNVTSVTLIDPDTGEGKEIFRR